LTIARSASYRWRVAGRITIRCPTATFPSDAGAPAFTLDRAISGVRIGVRQDATWRSWQTIAARWVGRLRDDGAAPVLLQTGERTGPEGEKTRDDLGGWIDAIDCAVVGLGTCGSCTMWSVRDAILVEAQRKPVVAAICEEFVTHARTTATFLGHPNLKILVLPYPLETRADSELERIADAYYPQFLRTLGATR
jgi:hypothetical protein